MQAVAHEHWQEKSNAESSLSSTTTIAGRKIVVSEPHNPK